jgi:NAD(P)-dependent dehydrogenase (short-subunit alcohol dehydrogenase family)
MFVKSLGEKLKREQIRVFSVDPGGKFYLSIFGVLG